MSSQGFRGSNQGGRGGGQNISSEKGATPPPPPPQQKKRTAWIPEYDKFGQEAQKYKIFA